MNDHKITTDHNLWDTAEVQFKEKFTTLIGYVRKEERPPTNYLNLPNEKQNLNVLIKVDIGPKFLKLFQKIKENAFQLILQGQDYFDTKTKQTDQKRKEKRKVQTSISLEHAKFLNDLVVNKI